MKRLKWIAGLSAIALLLGCGKQPRVEQPQATAPKPQAPLIQAAAPSPPALLPVPIAPITKTVPVKGLVAATNPQAQATAIVTTPKRDPFAPILSFPAHLKAVMTKTAPSSSPSIARLPKTTAKVSARGVAVKSPPRHPLAPSSQVAVSPPALDLSTNQPLVNLPSRSAPPLVQVSPTNLAEAIEITGVVQTTGKWVAIVKIPGDSGRYVQVGETLAGGQVLLKKIVIGKSGEPRVILQENGVEVMKSIGEASPLARSL